MAHPPEIKQKALALYATGGLSIYAVADLMRLPHATVRGWLDPRKQENERLRRLDPENRAKAAARARRQYHEEKLDPEKKAKKYARSREYCKKRWQEIKSDPERLAVFQAKARERWRKAKADRKSRAQAASGVL